MNVLRLWLAIPAALLVAATTACTPSGAPAASASTPASATPAASTPATDPPSTTVSPPAATAGASAAGGTTRTTSVGACTNASIRATIVAQPERTSGSTRMAMVQLTNGSSSTCTLSGWASVRLTNAIGDTVTVPTKLVDQPGPATKVELRSGTTASAGIKWTVCAKSSVDCPVGNGLTVVLPANGGAAPTGVDGFPAPERSDLTLSTLQIGTIQPSNEGVVAW